MKKIFALIIAVMLILGFCFAVSLRKNDAVFVSEESVTEKISIYRVLQEGNFIVLCEYSGEDKRIIKKAPGMPEREVDRKALEKGIETVSLDDALMIFEDFVS